MYCPLSHGTVRPDRPMRRCNRRVRLKQIFPDIPKPRHRHFLGVGSLHSTSRGRYLLPHCSRTKIHLSSSHAFIPWEGRRTSRELVEARPSNKTIDRSKNVSWDVWGPYHKIIKDRIITRYGFVSWGDKKRVRVYTQHNHIRFQKTLLLKVTIILYTNLINIHTKKS